MPIYAYRCDACGHRQDVLQKMSDPTLTVCPACSAGSFARQLSAPAFQLKGTGWYVTDFRDNGKKAGGDAGKPSSTGDGDGKTGDGKTGDDKPAGKLDRKSGDAGGESATSATPAVTPSATAAKAGAAASPTAGGTSAG